MNKDKIEKAGNIIIVPLSPMMRVITVEGDEWLTMTTQQFKSGVWEKTGEIQITKGQLMGTFQNVDFKGYKW